jgi:hypothetical protein
METNHLSYSSKNNFWQAISNKLFNQHGSVVSSNIVSHEITDKAINMKRNVTIKTNLPWLVAKIFGHETISYNDDVSIDLEKKELIGHTFTPSGFETYGDMKETQKIYENVTSEGNNVTCDVDLEFKVNGNETVARTVISVYEKDRFDVVKTDLDTDTDVNSKETFLSHFQTMVKSS